MATMQMPCSTKLKSLNTSLVHNRVTKLSYVKASATVTTTHTSHQAKNSFKLNVNDAYKPMFQELPMVTKKLETLIDKQELEKEVDEIVERLKIVVDKLVEVEIKRFMDRVNGETLSNEENLFVDEMTKEIVMQYLEKPISYLKGRSCKVNIERKIKDMRFLVDMLEETLLG